MLKKTFAAIALAILAVFAVPAAASAVDAYVPASNATVSGAAEPGGSVTVGFAAGSFLPGESVTYVVTGEGDFTLSVFKVVRHSVDVTKAASASGASSVTVNLPADATGSYDVVATSASGIVGTASVTVAAADSADAATDTDASATDASGSDASSDGLPGTGYNAPMLVIWGAGGALLLGIALVVVLGIVRRKRSAA